MAAATLASASTEQIIFPEIDLDKVKHLNGMHITIVTNATDQRGGQRAARRVRFPLQEELNPR